MIDAGKQRNKSCRCEDIGLSPGISLYELNRLSGGCTEGTDFFAGHICPTLDSLRRMMGH